MILWCGMAAAAPFDLTLAATAGFGEGMREAPPYYGARGAVEWPRGAFAVGADATVAIAATGRPTASLGPSLRLGPTSVPRVSAVMTAGLLAGPGVDAFVAPGLAVDLGALSRPGWRIQAAYRFAPTRGARWLEVSVGRLWPRRSAPDPMWRPEPVCDVVDEDLPPDQIPVNAALSGRFDRDGLDELGVLVVAAFVGDRVEVAGELVLPDEQGIVVWRVDGAVTTRVVGGGRIVEREFVVSDDHALWWSVSPPAPRSIGFRQARSTLDDAARATLAELAGAAGDWSFEVRGGFSEEGDTVANRQLAQARARAVAEALVTLGVAADRVTTHDEPLAVPVGRPEDHRIATVSPVPKESP